MKRKRKNIRVCIDLPIDIISVKAAKKGGISLIHAGCDLLDIAAACTTEKKALDAIKTNAAGQISLLISRTARARKEAEERKDKAALLAAKMGG